MWATFWERFPKLKFSLTEGDIGWIPYFLWRAEHVNDRHGGWTKPRLLPRPAARRRSSATTSSCCFIKETVGPKLLDDFNIDNVCWESDYPHSDGTWPNAPEEFLKTARRHRPTRRSTRSRHQNAMKHYGFDPFQFRPKEQCTAARPARRVARRRRRHPRRPHGRRARPPALEADHRRPPVTSGPPRVLDATTGLAGAYCAKVFADAGARLDHLEHPGGDLLQRSLSGSLYEHLHLGARPVTGDAEVLAAGYDVVITGDPDLPQRLLAAHPQQVVVSITPFGTSGPWRDRLSTEFTLQAACGSTGERGSIDDGPLAAGGRLGEWITGTYAAVGALAALRRARRQEVGAHVDTSMLDAMAVTMVTYPTVFAELAGWPELTGPTRHRETPSIEPTKDGWIVVTTNSATQFTDFLVMIERPDLLEDGALRLHPNRVLRRDEFLGYVHEWTTARTSDEVLEQAGLFRIPAGPVLNGSTVPDVRALRGPRGVLPRARRPLRPPTAAVPDRILRGRAEPPARGRRRGQRSTPARRRGSPRRRRLDAAARRRSGCSTAPRGGRARSRRT